MDSLHKKNFYVYVRYLLISLSVALALTACFESLAEAADQPSSLTQVEGLDGCFDNESLLGCAGPPSSDVKGLREASSVVIHPKGKYAYATGHDGDTIVVFDRNPDTGGLTQKPGRQGCVTELDSYGDGPSGCMRQQHLNGVVDLAISPDGKNLYAVAAEASAVTVFEIASDGTLSPNYGGDNVNGCISNGIDGHDPAYDCGGSNTVVMYNPQAVVATNSNIYVGSTGEDLNTPGGVIVFNRKSTGSLTVPSGSGKACVARDGGHFGYCSSAHSVSAVYDLAISPDGRNLYAVSADQDSVTTLTIDPSDGHLSTATDETQCVSNSIGGAPATDPLCRATSAGSQDAPTGVAVSPDGSHVYTTSIGSNAVSAFTRSSSGELKQLPRDGGACISGEVIAGCTQANGGLGLVSKVALSNDGLSLYTAAPYSHAVAAFNRDSASGKITQLSSPDGCEEDSSVASGECDPARAMKAANNLAISPDDNFVYVTTFGSPYEAKTPTVGCSTKDCRTEVNDGAVAIFQRTIPSSEPEPDHPKDSTDTVTTAGTPAEDVSTPTASTTAESATSPITSTCISLTAAKKQWAVTKWSQLPKTRVRLETKSGAYMLNSGDKSRALLKVRGIDGHKGSVDKVTYSVDDVQTLTTSKDPYYLTLNPAKMSEGYHYVKAVVSRDSSKTTLTLRVVVAACEPAHYTFATSSKLRRAHPNLRLWWQSGSATMSEMTATLPQAIRVRPSVLTRYEGRVFGGVQITSLDGQKRYLKLKIPSRIPVNRELKLLKSSDGITVSMVAKTGGEVKVTGLPSGINAVRVWLRGKTIKFFRNVNRCEAITSKAVLKNAVSSLSLNQTAKLCSNKK